MIEQLYNTIQIEIILNLFVKITEFVTDVICPAIHINDPYLVTFIGFLVFFGLLAIEITIISSILFGVIPVVLILLVILLIVVIIALKKKKNKNVKNATHNNTE